MKFHYFYTSLIISVLFASCVTPPQYKDDPANPGGNDSLKKPCNPDTAYFSKDVFPIISSSCAVAGCHNAASAKGGVILDSYENIIKYGKIKPGKPADSDLYEVITETDPKKRMPEPPASPLPQSQIDLIGKWIQQGALNNSCDAGCDSVNVTWNKNINSIMQKNCVSCHGNSAPGAGINLTLYATAKTLALNGQLYGVTAWQPGFKPMPQGGNKIDNCSVNQIRIWAANGAPEN